MWNFLFSLGSAPQSKQPTTHSSLSLNEKKQCCNAEQATTKFNDLKFLKKVSKGKFPVYLVQDKVHNKKFALKAFSYKNEQLSSQFQNEIRFSKLSHPSIISIASFKEQEETKIQGRSHKMSYILMEYAPYGDMFDLVMTKAIEWHDKLVRTYFHQLVEGLEYLHSNGVAHLDIKLENLLTSEDFSLKIADFDLSQLISEGKATTKGSKNYRAPEITSDACESMQAADVYSAGIVLFVMSCGGVLPYIEGQTYNEVDLYDQLHNKTEDFWESQAKIQNKRKSSFDEDFRSLFESMTRKNSKERASLEEVKSSKWYQGPVYTRKELTSLMKDIWSLIH